jgi:hypothetical protein
MLGLKICLWVTGILCLLCVFGMFLPVSTLESFTKLFGIESLSGSPLGTYMVRVMSATYVAIGVFFIMLAFDPMKYGVIVPFSGIVSVFLGVVCGITGPMVGMPTKWFLGDTLSCLVLGVLILVFWQKAKKAVKRQAGM